uniref:Uncharacterized protein n=1 Tax=Tanacetum cinerariifolium TaxID=118510 RepID=A0A699GY61_TANCI|nr:hypothetical protein [Tanacetum cinerariifolium]
MVTLWECSEWLTMEPFCQRFQRTNEIHYEKSNVRALKQQLLIFVVTCFYLGYFFGTALSEKNMNSGYVMENVLIRCGESLVGNARNKKYNKYNEITLCKGTCVGILRMIFGDYLVKIYVKESFRLKGLNRKMRDEDDDDKNEIK